MTSKSLPRDTRLNIFLRSRKTAALEGAWVFLLWDYDVFFNGKLHGFDDGVNTLVDAYCPIKRDDVGCIFLAEVGGDMPS